MYAVIDSFGKQYKVKVNDIISINYSNKIENDIFIFKNILFLFNNYGFIKIGRPFLDNAFVYGYFIGYYFSKKNIVIKFKRRKHHMKKIVYKNKFIRIKISKIIY